MTNLHFFFLSAKFLNVKINLLENAKERSDLASLIPKCSVLNLSFMNLCLKYNYVSINLVINKNLIQLYNGTNLCFLRAMFYFSLKDSKISKTTLTNITISNSLYYIYYLKYELFLSWFIFLFRIHLSSDNQMILIDQVVNYK